MVLNLSPVLDAPMCNIVPNLVYAASGHEAKMVMLAGKTIVRDAVVLTADERTVRAEAQMQVETLAEPVVVDPVTQGMVLPDAMQASRL